MNELYTKETADLIESQYGQCIGREYFYEDGAKAILKEISVEPFGEVADYGVIKPGHQVLFRFEGGKIATPATFVIVNKGGNVPKSHSILDQKTKNALITNKHMFGDWTSEDGSIKISINKEKLVMVKDGVKQTYSFGGEWYGDYFKLPEGSLYIKHANPETMVLGVLKNYIVPTEGHIWQKTFIRN